MISFNEFIKNYGLKKATGNIKIYEVLKKIGLDSKMRIYLRDGPFESDIGIVNLHPFRGTHWILFVYDCYFDSYGCAPPKKLSNFIIKRNGNCLYSEYQIQKMILFVQVIVNI